MLSLYMIKKGFHLKDARPYSTSPETRHNKRKPNQVLTANKRSI